MGASGATRKSPRSADEAALNVPRDDGNVSETAVTTPAGGSEGGATPTPFYDNLMALIDATAQENRRLMEHRHNAQNDNAPGSGDPAAPGDAAADERRVPRLILSVAGLSLAAIVGGFFLVPRATERPPSVVAADPVAPASSAVPAAPAGESRSAATGDADATGKTSETRITTGEAARTQAKDIEDKGTGEASASAAPASEASETSRPTGELADARATDIEDKGTAEAAASASPSPPNDQTAAADAPSAEQPREDAAPAEGAAGGQVSTAAAEPEPGAPATETASDEPLPPQEPPSLPDFSVETSAEPDASDAMLIAKTTSAVRMRAGPSNGQAVLTTIPAGTPVEVINCRQWCEVSFRGHRGWVYKTFLNLSAARRP